MASTSNPSKGVITFEYSLPANLKISGTTIFTVINALGQRVMEQNIDKRNGKLQSTSEQFFIGYIYVSMITNSGVVGISQLV